ncbi:glycosyltransferase family 4 protein [Thiosocius teredinicola]|uniref:glycosyltransferase family 4 protein n=1 Tax=Thiosocius teredinicola TaxID=1973002 RepID=UPI00099146A6
MRILYHHRTQAGDAQGIHIREIIGSLRDSGHEVNEVALVLSDAPKPATGDADAKPSMLSRLKDNLPDLFRELAEIGYNLVGFFKLLSAARRIKPDFIYERYALFNFSGVLVARVLKIPVILEVNSPLAMEQADLGQQKLGGLARRAERWICNHATVVITVSTPLKQILVDMGVEAERIVVMSNGVDPERFHGRRDAGDAVRARFGLDGKRVVGFVGWVREWHGIEDLVRGMPDWPADLGDVHLLVIGDGPARADIEAAARAVGVAERVHVTGAVEHAQIVEYLAAIDVALQPAATTYASPMKIFEYLAMAKPVVSVDQGNTREILTEGENALFFPPGDRPAFVDAVKDMFSDQQRLERMSEAARNTIFNREYLWRRNAEKVVDLAAAHRPHD